MVYPNSVVPLSLLLGASGMTVSAAATPSCSSQNLSVYMGREGCKRPTMARATPRGMDTSTARLNSGPDSSRLTGSASDIVGPTRPVNITTTKDVPRVMLPSKESDGLPIGGTERTTGWMDPQQKVYNVMDGYLDIVGASDEGPMTVKIASLGFPDDSTGRNPFELGPETELGSAIFLAPTDSPEASLAAPSSHVSNHTMATFDARSVPLGVFSTYNATSSSPSATTAPIAVRLKASRSRVANVPPAVR
ncbi:hypothetical protein FRC08_005627 [Ceratobasidium sp. 394]|nr:hypothetical protein FRC08_005627 [Ceratobasidium sp. 394]